MASRIVEAIQKNLGEKTGITVKEVHLKKGELRILSEEALKSAYQMLTEATELAGSELVIKEVKTIVHCQACDYRGEVKYHEDKQYHFSVPILECPKCNSLAEIKEGRELDLTQLIVEEDANGDPKNKG